MNHREGEQMKEIKRKVELFIEEQILTMNHSITCLESECLDKKVLKLLLSSKYRKYSIEDEIKSYFTEKIKFIINNHMDMIFVPSFGGYKHSWSPTYPNADWAELFNIRCLYDYLSPVEQLIQQKVYVEYLSKDIIIPAMNNISKEYVNQYLMDFKKLLDVFNQNQSSISFYLKSSHEDYDSLILKQLMEKEKNDIENNFRKLSIEEQEKRLNKSQNNLCWNGVEDYTTLTDDEKREIIFNSRIINETFLKVDSKLRGGSAANRLNAIPILFRKGLGANSEICLNICSCKSSTVAFWVGMGILEIREDKIVPRIISQRQYDKIKNKLIKINIDIESLKNISSHFTYIYVYIGKLDF